LAGAEAGAAAAAVALPAGTGLAGAGLAGFGADFTTGAAADRVTGLTADVASAGLADAALLGDGGAGALLAVALPVDGLATRAAGAALEDLLAGLGAGFFVSTFAALVGFAAALVTFGAVLTAAALATLVTALVGAGFFATGLAGAAFFAAVVLAAGLAAADFFAALLPAELFPATDLVAAAFLAGAFGAGLATFPATVLAAFFSTTGLAVFLAALTAFFAVFLAATKRSSLVSPGPGKAGLYSLPDLQRQLGDGHVQKPSTTVQHYAGRAALPARQGTWPAPVGADVTRCRSAAGKSVPHPATNIGRCQPCGRGPRAERASHDTAGASRFTPTARPHTTIEP